MYNLEIERKYLVKQDKLPPLPSAPLLTQGYLSFREYVRLDFSEPRKPRLIIGDPSGKREGGYTQTLDAEDARQLGNRQPANIRIRLEDYGDDSKNAGYITIKTASGSGSFSRNEFEVSIPPTDAARLIEWCYPQVVSKRRYKLPATSSAGQPTKKPLKWELDIFEGDNAGLIVAEIELPSEDYPFDQPDWLGEDVTDEPQYLNSSLATNPYKNWQS